MAAAAGGSGSSSSNECPLTSWGGGSGSPSSKECPLPSWAMLDRFAFTRLDLDSWEEDETTSPLCRTSSDDPFRVSFRFAAPPAVSRFVLHVKGGNLSENCHNTCHILSSHRNALLFCLYVPLPTPVEYLRNPKGEPFPILCKQDLFVYVAGDTPSLQLLPPCPNPNPPEGPLGIYDPLAKIIQFPSDYGALGVVCIDSGHYIVAHLCVIRDVPYGSWADGVGAQLCVYSSSDSAWELYELPIFCEEEDLDALFRWSTTTTVAFGTCLCWIDYNSGILFCDMARKPLSVTYFSLPVEYDFFPRVDMSDYRSISIVQEEGISKMKFVDVRPSRGYVYPPRPDGFEINFWTLTVKDYETLTVGGTEMKWKHEHELVLGDSELCISSLVPAPHGPLTLPIVGMEEPHVGYFAVCGIGCRFNKVWLVSVDLIKKSVKSLLPFLNVEDIPLPPDDADLSRIKRRGLAPFLPSEITKFFQKVAADSIVVMKAHDALPNCLQADMPEPNLGRLYSEASKPSDGCQQVSIRLLCPNHLVGSLIGKKGLIIKEIEYKTDVCIAVGPCIGGCRDCVITIAAIESPDQCSKVQDALGCIFGRMVEVEMSAQAMFDKPSKCSARVLVHERQVADLGVDAIKEIVDISRARIKILDRRYLPACASRCERVLQISGNLSSVSYALCLVNWKLRNQVFSSKRTNYDNGYSNFVETNATRQQLTHTHTDGWGGLEVEKERKQRVWGCRQLPCTGGQRPLLIAQDHNSAEIFPKGFSSTAESVSFY